MEKSVISFLMTVIRQTSHKFLVQWHITDRCDQHCLHCYYGSAENRERSGDTDLGYNECRNIIDDFDQMLKGWGISGRINFTGGDPFLHPEWWEIMSYASSKGIAIGILGNPHYLDEKTLERIKILDLVYYQLSIDGMQVMHDFFRGPGHFQKTVDTLRLLKHNGIRTAISYTLSRTNKDDLPAVIRLASDIGVNLFDFSRLVPIGSGENFRDQAFTPQEYHGLLKEVALVYDEIRAQNNEITFGRKDPLWVVAYNELGKMHTIRTDDDIIYAGCSAGNQICILQDGTVLPCRRLPIRIGTVPEQSLKTIFITSPVLKKLRDLASMEKCSTCNYVQYCRGCRGIAYASTGSVLGVDPGCWN